MSRIPEETDIYGTIIRYLNFMNLKTYSRLLVLSQYNFPKSYLNKVNIDIVQGGIARLFPSFLGCLVGDFSHQNFSRMVAITSLRKSLHLTTVTKKKRMLNFANFTMLRWKLCSRQTNIHSHFPYTYTHGMWSDENYQPQTTCSAHSHTSFLSIVRMAQSDLVKKQVCRNIRIKLYAGKISSKSDKKYLNSAASLF